MTQLLTSAQMRAIESAAISGGAVTGRELMERAGQGFVDAVFAHWPGLGAGPGAARVLCGPGNNGGDGFVIARLLAARRLRVEVRLFGDAARLPPDARANRALWEGPVLPIDAPLADGGCDLIVDALFGTGLARPLPDAPWVPALLPERDLRAEPGRPRVAAVDIPSGLCADSGRVIGGVALWADLTVSFHTLKRGHVLADGPAHCGRVVVADIGLDDDGAGVPCIASAAPGLIDKAEPHARDRHKYSHGHALVLSGPMGRSGAARLAARAALRIGAGAVTLGAPGSAMMECATQITAIMLRRCDDADALAAILADARISAVCLGPGLSRGPQDCTRLRDLVAAAMDDLRRGVVLDADALTAFADEPEALFSRLHPQTVLTPHMGEFARLFPDIAARLSAPASRGPAMSRLDAVAEAAARAGCTVLLKGQDTVIADETGALAVNAAVYDRSAPWLATAGAGDVLAGIIAGLMARGRPAFAAACAGAWLHVEAARAAGPGLIAEDLPDALPDVLRALLAGP